MHYQQAEPVAIIGMSCRFPGSPDLASFWELLHRGADAITQAPPDRGITDPASGPDGRRFGGFLPDVGDFDAAYFGIGPAEAAAMDPHQRLALELGVHAVQDAAMAVEHSFTGKDLNQTWSDAERRGAYVGSFVVR